MFTQNEYTRLYFEIISQGAKIKPTDSYSEKHHIVPRSLGGVDKKDNIVYLTAAKHFECHQLLIHMTVDSAKGKMWNALWRMMNKQSMNQQRDYTFTAYEYEEARKQHAIAHSLNMSGQKNPFFGKLHTHATRTTMSAAKKGKSYEEIFGTDKASEMRNRRRAEQQGLIKGPQTIIVCPHCNKTGGTGIMKRWHFDRCKFKGIDVA